MATKQVPAHLRSASLALCVSLPTRRLPAIASTLRNLHRPHQRHHSTAHPSRPRALRKSTVAEPNNVSDLKIQRIAQKRWQSTPAPKEPNTKLYTYEEIKALVATPSKHRILIDVREPHEFAAGAIPTAINIPLKSQPDALFLPKEEFEERFGFEKPHGAAAEEGSGSGSAEAEERGREVVFYCRSGVRSKAAAGLAVQAGYGAVGEYRGSWVEWVEREGVGGRVV